MDGPLERFTAQTLVDRAVIDRQLAEYRDTQLTWDFEEHSEGICAVGTALLDAAGRSYAISIPVPTARFRARAVKLGEALQAHKQRCLDAARAFRM